MNLKSKRLLLTGATGSIGPYLLPHLLSDGWEVILVGRTRPALEHPRLTFKAFDLQIENDFNGLTSGCDTVLHMANLSKTDLERDFIATDLLAADALAQGVLDFFYTSSIRVYGAACGEVDENTKATPHPDDAYGRNKLRIEQHLEQKTKGTPLRLRVLRVGHVVSEQSQAKMPERLSLAYLLLWGRTYPHYIQVKDISDVVRFLLENRTSLRHQLYNITREESNVKRTFNDFYSAKLPTWQKHIANAFSLPAFLPHVLIKNSAEAQGTRSARITSITLAAQGWHYSGEAL